MSQQKMPLMVDRVIWKMRTDNGIGRSVVIHDQLVDGVAFVLHFPKISLSMSPSTPDDVPCQLESLPCLVRCVNQAIQSEYTSCKVAKALLEW